MGVLKFPRSCNSLSLAARAQTMHLELMYSHSIKVSTKRSAMAFFSELDDCQLFTTEDTLFQAGAIGVGAFTLNQKDVQMEPLVYQAPGLCRTISLHGQRQPREIFLLSPTISKFKLQRVRRVSMCVPFRSRVARTYIVSRDGSVETNRAEFFGEIRRHRPNLTCF